MMIMKKNNLYVSLVFVSILALVLVPSVKPKLKTVFGNPLLLDSNSTMDSSIPVTLLNRMVYDFSGTSGAKKEKKKKKKQEE